ncbi:STAS domain-containing protein [Nocardioides sp. C4-1]|uniref:STAS domain-containing protein n=1 Tax=Nocardioides sp. C4-1 TaxID=3151851 RepID=UPI00326301C3
MPDVDFATHLDSERSCLTVSGEVDETMADVLLESLRSASDDFTKPLTIDLSAVTYLPSAAVGVLVTSEQKARSHGNQLDLVAARGTIAQRVLEVCALPHRTD